MLLKNPYCTRIGIKSNNLINVVPHLELNSYKNQTIMHILIEKILISDGIDNFIKQNAVFLCNVPNNKNLEGYNLMPFSGAGDLSEYLDKLSKKMNLI